MRNGRGGREEEEEADRESEGETDRKGAFASWQRVALPRIQESRL